MSIKKYQTASANKQTVTKGWFLINAANQTVGRLASVIAARLRGKHQPYYTPHVDCGDYIVVVNAAQVVFTGKKEKDKIYISHTGYPGGQRETTPRRLRDKQPERILEHAIKGMLPKNKLGRALFRNLFVYTGAEHPHQAQNPQTYQPYKL